MIEIIKNKLKSYGAANALEEENATKEILQEIALYALWRANFFDCALFQGGTSLRILHGLPRFSEGLDFMLRAPDAEFDWTPYLKVLLKVLGEFGLKSEVLPKGRMDAGIRQALVKNTSIAHQLDFVFIDRNPNKKIKIRLEIDVEPPPHSGETTTFLDFPLDHEVRHQDLASNFALKIHALLCRGFLKGRDWYDFSWYVSKGVFPNLPHLKAALQQFGPWAGNENLHVDTLWFEQELKAAIGSIDWNAASNDVYRFLRPTEAKSLDLWSERFFTAKLSKMMENAS